jgi:hypothetical protein
MTQNLITQVKRYFIVIVLLIVGGLPAAALLTGFGPENFPGHKNYGTGVYFAPNNIKIYEDPDLNSSLKEILNWNIARVQINSATGEIEDPHQAFIAFYPYKGIAIMTVSDDIENWAEVIYDQKSDKRGWVYLKTEGLKTEYNPYVGNFYTWLQFMQTFARKNLLYFISGVPKSMRTLRSAPQDNARPVNYDFSQVRSIEFKHIRGNWLLVRVRDLGQGSPIGWLRWRTDDGKLVMFCSF